MSYLRFSAATFGRLVHLSQSHHAIETRVETQLRIEVHQNKAAVATARNLASY
jgi:hypothetical protein